MIDCIFGSKNEGLLDHWNATVHASNSDDGHKQPITIVAKQAVVHEQDVQNLSHKKPAGNRR